MLRILLKDRKMTQSKQMLQSEKNVITQSVNSA